MRCKWNVEKNEPQGLQWQALVWIWWCHISFSRHYFTMICYYKHYHDYSNCMISDILLHSCISRTHVIRHDGFVLKTISSASNWAIITLSTLTTWPRHVFESPCGQYTDARLACTMHEQMGRKIHWTLLNSAEYFSLQSQKAASSYYTCKVSRICILALHAEYASTRYFTWLHIII